MKITDISESSKPSSSAPKEEDKEEVGYRKRSLLEKFNVAIEEIDYDFVRKCNDSKKVERILRILRSGEEGSYPDLERCVMERLDKLNPRSRLLRVETPALRLNELGDAEKTMITQGLSEWISSVSGSGTPEACKEKSIFDLEENEEKVDEVLESFPLPVRGTTAQGVTEMKNKQFTVNKSKSNEKRIKSWEYDKWDKFDVDKELTKLDIADMQAEEWEKRLKPKVIEEQKRIEKLMKEDGNGTSYGSKEQSKKGGPSSEEVSKPLPPKATPPPPPEASEKPRPREYWGSVDEKSYIEEINSDDDNAEGGMQPTSNFKKRTSSIQSGRSGAPRLGSGRRTKIIIDDLHMPM